MRICAPHCGIAPETTSGGETYEREMLERLGRAGVRIELILARGKPHPQGVPNWTVHRFPIGRGLRWYVAPLVVPPAIRRVHEEAGFDLLRVHSLRYIGPSALAARRLYGLDVPVVSHHHHLDPNPLNRVIEKRVVDASDRVVVGSEFGKRQLREELGARTDHVSVVHYGVDARFAPRPRREDLQARYGLAGRRIVLYFGGLKPRKNLGLLLDAWRALAPLHPDATLLIAGGGALLDELRTRARRLGLDGQTVFTGYVAEAEKADHFNLGDVFVFPSAMEGFGLTVAEAMASGLPVVASNRGSIPELVVDGEGGFLCDPSGPEPFIDPLSRLLGDRALGEKLGWANRERAERLFRWERCVDATRRVYEQVLEEWRRVPGRQAPAMKRLLVRGVDLVNRRGKGWACRLVQLTGKHPDRIHPKHLIQQDRAWFRDHLKPGDHVLDLGCGTGLHGLTAAVDGCRVTWCDRDTHMMRDPLLKPLRFVQADLEDPLPFKARSFDAVLLLDVLEHLHNRIEALEEARRILKTDGLLFLAVPNAGTRWRRRLAAAGLFAYSDPDHKAEYLQPQIEQFVGQFFTLVTVYPVPALDTPWAGLIDLVGGLHLPTYRRLVAWKRRAALAHPEESTGFCVVARKRP